ncbi:MAG: hypothetical protein V5A46_04730 [Haloferacaceae archaeon]
MPPETSASESDAIAENDTDEFRNVSTETSTPVEHPIDPDGVMDNTLTVLVGIVGGFVIGIVGTTVLLILTGSGLGILFGLAAWLGATAFLVRRRYLLDAVSKTAYGIAIGLVLVPLVALVFDASFLARGGVFLVLLFAVGLPAVVAAGIGWFASRYVPEEASVG